MSVGAACCTEMSEQERLPRARSMGERTPETSTNPPRRCPVAQPRARIRDPGVAIALRQMHSDRGVDLIPAVDRLEMLDRPGRRE